MGASTKKPGIEAARAYRELDKVAKTIGSAGAGRRVGARLFVCFRWRSLWANLRVVQTYSELAAKSAL